MEESIVKGNLDLYIKGIDLAGRIGVVLGGATLLIYCLRIGYFPQELSIGDSILLMFMGIGFGVLYIAFTVSMTAFAIAMLYPAHRLFAFLSNKANIRALQAPAFPYPWVAWTYGSVAPLFIFVLPRDTPQQYLHLAILCGLLYSVYFFWKRIGTDHGAARQRIHCVALWIVIPFLFGQFNGRLAEGAMRLLGVQVDNTAIYIKEPFAHLIPLPPTDRESKELGARIEAIHGYRRFDSAKIQFRGVGKATLITINNSSSSVRLEVPNDHVVVVNEAK